MCPILRLVDAKVCDFCVIARFGNSRGASGHLIFVDHCVNSSSIVFNFSALPLALALGIKISWPSDSVSKPPHRPHRVSASKVSYFDFARSTDVYGFK